MEVPRTFWLVLTNVLLGLGTLVCLIGTVVAAVCGIVEVRKKRRARIGVMDREYHQVFEPQASRPAPPGFAYIDASFESRFSHLCSCLQRFRSAFTRRAPRPATAGSTTIGLRAGPRRRQRPCLIDELACPLDHGATGVGLTSLCAFAGESCPSMRGATVLAKSTSTAVIYWRASEAR